MTQKTAALLQELTQALFVKKALLLIGNSGTGKTFLAKKAAEALKEKQYNLFGTAASGDAVTEIISCHGSVAYEDIAGGISAETDHGKMSFRYQDKILLQMLKQAQKDYQSKKENRYILILDDVQRNDLSVLMGDVFGAAGTEGEQAVLSLNNGEMIHVPPNFYIIATYNPSEQGAAALGTDWMSKFYIREILSDIGYITEDMESEQAIWYDRIRDLIFRYLTMQYQTSTYEQNRYMPGHGCFAGDRPAYKIKLQLIPLLKQYIAEGILDVAARDTLAVLENACREEIKKTGTGKRTRRISDYKCDVTADRFLEEDATSVPLENLVGRIVQQGLIPDAEIETNILNNSNICCREKVVSGRTYRAALLAGKEEYEHLCRNTGDKRKFYNAGTIKIQGKKYHFTGGMQPKEYTLKRIWDSLKPYPIGESTSPNVILFGIIRHYYRTILEDLEMYLRHNPSDTDKKRYYAFVKEEWETFLEDYKKIKPAGTAGSSDRKEAARQKADANKKANLDVRERISRLVLLWKDLGDVIVLQDGTEITAEGVERTMGKEIYEEYRNAMETLGVKQMILQGPPGTSKTYSAKEFLKYAAGNCTDAELADMQITGYSDPDQYCGQILKGRGEPEIAWDIVQFHPSYGYEDFIRGIRVSTKPGSDTIFYETVNKVLGNIAELAEKHPSAKFYLIIDEINRANLAAVFGELIYGLEYRTEPVATPYAVESDNRISIPENLYMIGTMNTADKSISGIDYAIRRRFLFFEQLPDIKVIQEYKKTAGAGQEELNQKACRLFEKISGLFGEDYLSPEYRKEDVQIGHTYFLADTEDKLRMRFEYQIIPILKEYYKDGILSFTAEDSEEGFEGLLNCIAGKINLAADRSKAEKIFHELIS